MRVETIENLFKRKRYAFFKEGFYNLNIIGVRNDFVRPDFFDDQIYVLYRNEAGEWKSHSYEATTDPGLFWLKNPIRVEGTAILVPGQYRKAYRIGKHKGKDALVQVKPVKVYRDRNRDDVIDIDPETVMEGNFQINIHDTSSDNHWSYKEDKVGKWSAGCQVIQNVAAFQRFLNLCRKAASLYGNRFTYTLIEKKDYVEQMHLDEAEENQRRTNVELEARSITHKLNELLPDISSQWLVSQDMLVELEGKQYYLPLVEKKTPKDRN